MSIYTSVDDFNNHISTLTNKYNIDEYIRLVHSHFYNDIDIILLNEYIKYEDNPNIFNIDSDILYKFDLIQHDKDIFISKFIKDYQLIEDIDYKTTIKTGIIHLPNNYNKEYKLTTYAFKYCLLLSGNSKCIKYFLLIERIISYYKKYEELYNENNNIFDKIVLLFKEQNITSQSDVLETINKKIEDLNCKSELYGININLNELTNKINNINTNINKILSNKIYNDIDIILSNSVNNNDNNLTIISNIKELKSEMNAIIDLYSDIVEKIDQTYVKFNHDEDDIDDKINNLQNDNKNLTIKKKTLVVSPPLIKLPLGCYIFFLENRKVI